MAGLKAPFPWFGGKSRVAPMVWARFGNPINYVEPFFGSGAVLLGRPMEHFEGGARIETVNDLDGFVCNAWRAIKSQPGETADWADWPVNECDLHARHLWLKKCRESFTELLMGDPDYCDAKIAGWWLWGIACWIGSGFCGDSGSGPWGIEIDAEGRRHMVRIDGGAGVQRRRPHLGDGGRGVSRKLPHLGNGGRGLASGNGGRGLASGNGGRGLASWFQALAARLRRVRIVCGDWRRVMGRWVTYKHGMTGILLDPPYGAEEGRTMNIYAKESGIAAGECRDWCLAHGDNPLLRIALCGYGETHDALLEKRWMKERWKAGGGYVGQGNGPGRENSSREAIWFSPACLDPTPDLFNAERMGPNP